MKRFEVEYFMNGKTFTIEIDDVEHDYEARERILETFEVGDATEIKNTQENMKHLRKFNEEKEETQEMNFDAKQLVDKEAEAAFTSDVEDQEKVEKQFNKEMDKVEKFESFVTIHVDNIENVELENECEIEEEGEEPEIHHHEEEGDLEIPAEIEQPEEGEEDESTSDVFKFSDFVDNENED